MNRTEIATLLDFIEGVDRRKFPPSAVDTWLAILAGQEARDVMQAAREALDTDEPVFGGIQPGPLRRRAARIRETREGAVRKQLESAAARATPPNEEYLAFRRRLAAQLGERGGDPERILSGASRAA